MVRVLGKGIRRWFSVDSKSFEFLVEGEGKKLKAIIIERSRGCVSWIRFGKEGLKSVLKGVDFFRREVVTKRRVFDWKENGRSYSLVCREKDAKSFFLCLVTDADEKRRRLFFPKGKGLLKGWTLLVEALCDLGIKMNI